MQIIVSSFSRASTDIADTVRSLGLGFGRVGISLRKTGLGLDATVVPFASRQVRTLLTLLGLSWGYSVAVLDMIGRNRLSLVPVRTSLIQHDLFLEFQH